MNDILWRQFNPEQLRIFWGQRKYQTVKTQLYEHCESLPRSVDIYDDWDETHLTHLEQDNADAYTMLMSILFHTGGHKWYERLK